MEATHTKLGWALAHLQAERTTTSSQLTPSEQDYLEHMKDRFKLLNGNGKMVSLLENLPDRTCLINQPFLADNEDFFIALFSDTKHDEACIRLYKHMNDCYPCFEIFSQVLRDYYRQGEVLKESFQEKNHG